VRLNFHPESRGQLAHSQPAGDAADVVRNEAHDIESVRLM